MVEKQKGDLRDRRLYRKLAGAGDLVAFPVTVKETDLMIMAQKDLREAARDLVLTHRLRIEEYIARHRDFLESLSPLPDDDSAPGIVRRMLQAGLAAAVGPMASVAGAVAEVVGESLREISPEIVVENGGDVFLAGERERTVALFTGESGLGSKLGLKVRPGEGLGVCTSSGRFGHSLSLGEAATATVVAPSAALADAAATAVGNVVRGADGIERGIALARTIEGVSGAVIVHEGKMGVWGAVEIAALRGE